MTHSSPGQARIFDAMDGVPMRGSLSDSAENINNQSGDSETPFHQQKPLVVSPPAPGKSQDNHQDVPQKEACSPNGSDELMLLERPSSLQRPLDLDKGYEYGPAVQFAPGFFTRRPGQQAPVRPEDHPQQAKGRLSAPSTQRDCSPRSKLPPLGRVPSPPLDNLTINQVRSLDPPDGSGTQPLTSDHGLAESSSNKHSRATASRKASQMVESPPFPDTSPKEPAVPSIKTRPTHIENQPTTTLGKAEARAKTSVPVTVNNAAPYPDSPHLLPYDRRTDSHYDSSRRKQQAALSAAERGQGGHKRHHHPPPQAASSQRFAGNFTDRSDNHMMTRPVREVAHIRPARSIHQVRPESRSSNVSKQRFAPFRTTGSHQILTL